MRIIQIIQRVQYRGAEIFAAQLSQELKNRGHEVMIIALQFGDAILPFDGEIIIINANISNRIWDYYGWRCLSEYINTYDADIVQANAGDTLKYAAISKMLYGWRAKLIFRNANKVSDYLNSWPVKLFNKIILRKLDYVVSVSLLCQADFIKSYNWPETKIAYLPIGINLPIPESYESLRTITIKTGFPKFLHCGAFVEEKNHEGLIRIFYSIRQYFPNAFLLLVGIGNTMHKIKLLVKEYEMEDAVIFLGNRNDILRIIPVCEGLLLPSLIEGLPGVILEAFLAKTPVVAYDVGGVSEVLRSKETGWLIEKNNELQFAKAVVDMITNKSEIKTHVIENAYRLVVSEFDNRVIAQKFIETYENVLS